MTDDRKYSSLYSAIQGIGKRPKRSSEASPINREGSPVHRENSATHRQSYPAPQPHSSQVGSVLKIPHVIENKANYLSSPPSPGGFRVGSILKIPQVIDNQDAPLPLPLHTSSGTAPASSFSGIDLNQNSTAPFDDAAYQSTGPQVSRSSTSTSFNDLNRSSQVEMGSWQVAGSKEYDQNQEVPFRASHAFSPKARFSIPPVGTVRSPRTSGRQSQFISLNEAIEPQEMLPSASQRASQSPASNPTNDLNHESRVEMGLFQVPETEEYKQTRVLPRVSRASSQKARFSDPHAGTSKSSRLSGRQSQFMSSIEAVEPQEVLLSASPQVQQSSTSTPFTDLNGGSEGEMHLFQVAETEDYDQNQEVSPRASHIFSQQAGVSVLPAGTDGSSRISKRQSQFRIPGGIAVPLPSTSPQVLQPSASIPVTGLARGSEGQVGLFQVPEDEENEENQEVFSGVSHASSQQVRFSIPPAVTTRSSRASGWQSQFMSPGKAVESQGMVPPTSQQVLQSFDSNHSLGVPITESEAYNHNQDVPPRASHVSSQQARFLIPPAGTNRSSRTNGRQSQFMSLDQVAEPQEMLASTSPEVLQPSTAPFTPLNHGLGGEFSLSQLKEAEGHDENRVVSPQASHASSQQPRFSVPPAGTSRSSRTSGRESRFMRPDEVVEPQEMLPSTSPKVSQSSTSTSFTGLNHSSGGQFGLFQVAEAEEHDENHVGPPWAFHASSQQARFSVPPRGTARNSRTSERQSQYISPDELVESQEMLPSTNPQVSRSSTSTPYTGLNGSLGAQIGLFQAAEAEEYDENRVVPPQASHASSQQVRFSIPPAGTTRSSRTSGQHSQVMGLAEAVESQEMLPPTNSQVAHSSDSNRGFGGELDTFPITESDEYDQNQVVPFRASHASSQQARFLVPPAGSTRSSRISRIQSQFMNPGEAIKPQEMLPSMSSQVSQSSPSAPLTDLNCNSGAETGLFQAEIERDEDQEVLPWESYAITKEAAYGEGQVYGEMASSRTLRQPSRFLSVAALQSTEHDDPYDQVGHEPKLIAADMALSPTAVPRDSRDVNGSPRKGSSFMQAMVPGETEGAQSSSSSNFQMNSSALDAGGSQAAGATRGDPLAMDPNTTEASLMPNQFLQRSSSLSFSKQIQKRGSLGMALTSGESRENMFNETGTTTSDSSSEDLGKDKRLSLESVSRPSFSAKLSEQQSMIRPWDTERLTYTERRMSPAFENSNYTRPESAGASDTYSETSTEDMPKSIKGVLNQQPSESLYGNQTFSLSESNDQQDEESARGSIRPSFDTCESPDIHTLQDPENLSLLPTLKSRKSLVQEFIYPTSPRHSFHETISPRTDQRESLHQEAGYQPSSPRLSVRQSLSNSRKDLTELQTQEFMYSPSLGRTSLGRGSDQVQDQDMQQSMNAEMDDAELPSQDLMLSLHSARQSFEQILPDENEYDEVHYEDPTFPTYFFQEKIEEEDEHGEAHPSLQQQDSNLMSGVCNEDALDDDECFDKALAIEEHDESEDLEDGDRIEDQLSSPPKDDCHSESFTNLEDTLGSFKRAFGSSTSFIKVPFGASELSYEGFAKVQFMEPTAGIWPVVWKSMAMQDLIRFCKVPLTQPLLQRLAAAPHKQCAVTSFTHLLAYMGDVPTAQDVVYHIQQILMLGIKYSDLRDEIFCQICKQTTANPSRWSNGRGWQAMALCVGTFAPSSTFRPFLEAHLQQVAGHFVGQWAGDTMSYQDEGMSNPSKAAEYCLTRFQKLMQAGSRRLPPLHAEINAVEKMESVRVNIYLPDDTFKVLDLDPMTTAEEVTHQLAQMNGLSDPKYYGIFQVLYGDVTVEKSLNKNTYIMEVLSDWNKASLPPLEKDLRLIAKAKFLFEKHLLCLPSTNIGLFDEENEEDSVFRTQMDPSKTEMIFKRMLFIEDLSSLSPDVQNAVQNFDYVQAVRDVAYGVYPVEEHDAVMLGALQLRADSSFFENLEEALTDEVVRKFGPKIYVEGSEREWKAALMRTVTALPPEPDMFTCINDYTDFLRSRCTLYGSCWYYVEQKADPRLPYEMFVAINTAGVYFVQVKTKEQLLHMQFTEICSWGYSTASFSLVTGNMTYNHDHRLITMQGSEIGETLQMYINRLQY